MHNCRFLRVERRSALSFLILCMLNNRPNSLQTALRRRPGDLGCEVVNKSDYASIGVDPPLDQIRIEKEVRDRRQRRSLRQSSLVQCLHIRLLSVDLNRCRPVRAESCNPPDHLLQHSPCSHPLKQSILEHAIVCTLQTDIRRAGRLVF